MKPKAKRTNELKFFGGRVCVCVLSVMFTKYPAPNGHGSSFEGQGVVTILCISI